MHYLLSFVFVSRRQSYRNSYKNKDKIIYKYIYIYLLIYYLPAFTVTKKKKKTLPEFRDNKSRITAWGKKKKDYREKKKKSPTSTHQLKKIKRYAISWSKEQKPTAKCCNATITKSAQF